MRTLAEEAHEAILSMEPEALRGLLDAVRSYPQPMKYLAAVGMGLIALGWEAELVEHALREIADLAGTQMHTLH